MQLTQLIYASTHKDARTETLDRILQVSRANNVRDGLTGALIISDRHFVQLLEGDQVAIAQCFMRIMLDTRHRDIRVVSVIETPRRLFGEWSMHRIEVSRVKQAILSRYATKGEFDPTDVSPFAIQDLCRTLSGGGWEATAA